MRILIVDPDWVFAGQTRDNLESRGHHVVSEPDPDRALERCQRWRPDVVLISAELTACCDGDLLPRVAKVQPRPAVVLTAALDRFDRAWCAWQRGGDDVLFKPVLHPSEVHVAIVVAMENAVCPANRRVIDRSRTASA